MKGVGVTIAMVTVESLQVVLNIIIKVEITEGMSNFVFFVYSNTFALFFLLPSTFIFHRNRAPPQITISIICKILVLGLLSFSVLAFNNIGIGYGSPTLASTMVDLTPACTFILAIISRTEKLDLKMRSSQAKSLGTVISIAGALIVTFCKGMTLNGPLHSQQSDWIIGGVLLAASSFCLSVLFNVLTWIIKEYPAELVVTSIACIFETIQSFIVALIVERNPKAWILRPDMELFAILYSAIFCSTIRNAVQVWACRTKGPVYVAMFKPLGIVIALVLGVVFLGDTLYLGRLIGAAIIVIGFFAVIWGQTRKEKIVSEESGISSSVSTSSKTPLLQNTSIVA
ncbi:WAT1-related protein [Quillaja saponaria]|uniref:WAT1-related protein n=1 Tax=Quillaja saponaria TaxID=32244 RepID=A0AAD7L9K9_QUISA|nr:WAT1-related protein [Quillaja saponaria]